MPDPTDRRYSEREFALILRKASELHEEQRDGSTPHGGMSLTEIQQIADEAGIDPRLVARAAALIGDADIAEGGKQLFGPSATVHITSSVEGELTEEDMRRLMEVVRYETAKTGTIQEVLGSVAWKADGEEAPLEVRVTPRDGRTTIEILSRSQVYKALAYVLGGTAGFLGSIITLPLVGVESKGLLLGLSLVVAPLLTAMAGRPFWTWWARRWRTRLTDLLDTLREEADRRALPPADPGLGDP